MSSSFEVPTPILNSPFEEPQEHWLIEEGKPPVRLSGRRRAGYYYRDPKLRDESEHGARGEWQELTLVNLIRQRLAEWRASGRPGITRTTGAARVLDARRPTSAAVLRPARRRGDDHLPDRGPP
jgi:type III restriction enzyme